MPARTPFEYTFLRVTPCIEREEFVNAGVLLFCKQQRFLGVRIELVAWRVLALDPAADIADIQGQLDLIPVIVEGGPRAGEIGELPLGERFRWLASPRNTIVQPSPVHPGLCTDPQAALDALFARLVQSQGQPKVAAR